MGWPVVWKCFVTCLFLKLSQQPTWPQLMHSLRWDPGISYLQTLLAALGTGCDVSYLVQMRTWGGHRSSPLGNTSADRGDSIVVNELSGTHQSSHNNVRREHDGRLCRSDRVFTAPDGLSMPMGVRGCGGTAIGTTTGGAGGTLQGGLLVSSIAHVQKQRGLMSLQHAMHPRLPNHG